ncbi:MAG: YHYH protein [bacterium]|nr:YHYH protein [Candidatus Kapabacteria bacterium]
MRTTILFAKTFLVCATIAHAQSIGPDVTSWHINTDGRTGYRGIPSNVQLVRFSDENVYVSCTCIPGYDIGPWAGNPNTPSNQDFVFRITRTPTRNSGAPIATPLGHIGVWTNGVSIFNAKDARSYNNANVWYQNAIVVEGPSFDTCLGHPAPNGEYHHHLNPRCLYDDRDSSKHSPIIGFAFDGFPIYGAYGFRNADGSGGAARMRSSYRLREMTGRTSLAGGSTLPAQQQGPPINVVYPLGYYIEDYEYAAAFGNLDEHNGRQCVTPEYPLGTYAYFVTLDENANPSYPYVLGPNYYGSVPAGNTGPQSGHNTPTEAVTTYVLADVNSEHVRESAVLFPNPASDRVVVTCDTPQWDVALHDCLGQELMRSNRHHGSMAIDVSSLADGIYFVMVDADKLRTTKLLIVQ